MVRAQCAIQLPTLANSNIEGSQPRRYSEQHPQKMGKFAPNGLAALQGPANVDAIAALTELGAQIGPVLEDSVLETPLHIAARCGRLDIIEKLIKCKVPVNLRTKASFLPCLLTCQAIARLSIRTSPAKKGL